MDIGKILAELRQEHEQLGEAKSFWKLIGCCCVKFLPRPARFSSGHKRKCAGRIDSIF